jgi:hypothetical protein
MEDFNTKVEREFIKALIWKAHLHEITNIIGGRVVNLQHKKCKYEERYFFT